MLLVTTAFEETWGIGEDILFLGEWCKLYERKNIWSNRNSNTLADPWSNRERRFIAYQYTEEVYNRTIELLANSLNKAHKLNYPLRYWKIICEPWLRFFIDSTYHNWECISDVIDGFQNIETIEIKTNLENQIPIDMHDFENKLTSDSWNHYIFSLIINSRASKISSQVINRINIDRKPIEYYKKRIPKQKLLLQFFYKLILQGFDFASRIFNGSTSVFIANPYLSKLNNIRLRIRLRVFSLSISLPQFNKKYDYNKDFRVDLPLLGKQLSEYEIFLHKIVLLQIPFSYVEGFSDLRRETDSNKWPKNPSAIVTATDHNSSDIFRYYCASRFLLGSKINIICHGGGGKYKYSDFQDMDFNVCDNYFTWGWTEYSSKCVPGFFIKDYGYRRNRNKDEKHLLHITLSQYRYQKGIDSTPSYEQYINEYLNDQIQLLNELKYDVKKETITKLSYDFQNSLKNRIDEKCSDVRYATMDDNYYKLLTNAKLVVTTYNCTTPVEALAMNIPTIIFWRSEHWELAPSAIPFFEKLRACGVFHDSQESAAIMINKIWDDVDGWWQSQEVLSACNEFRMWFCRESQDPISEIANFCKM
jgi:putative transferase (TIGR04331 family)